MIEVEELHKSYGELVAVDGVSLVAAEGAVFGLLGPNGAGKSTTIGCISGLLLPSSGRIRVLGHDVVLDARAAKACLGVVPQELALYEDLSATDNLGYWGAAYGLRGPELRRRVGEVLELTGLLDRAREPVKPSTRCWPTWSRPRSRTVVRRRSVRGPGRGAAPRHAAGHPGRPAGDASDRLFAGDPRHDGHVHDARAADRRRGSVRDRA